VKCSKFHTENPQLLGATVQNLVAQNFGIPAINLFPNFGCELVAISELFINEVLVKLELKNTIYASEVLGVMINYLDSTPTWHP
jgi:hypothetical protein